MHIVGLVDRIDHVCCRYRLRGYEPIWRRAGHSLELLTWDRSWWARCHPGAGLRHADVVVILRKLLPRWQLGLLRRAVRRLVFDFDDAVFLRDSYDRRGTHCPRRRRRFAAAVHASDAVVAGNSFLAAAALQTSGPGRVHVIPTCVEPERYPLAEHRSAGDAVSLVWVGSRSTLQGLEWIRPLLNQVGRACPGVRLKLICDTFLSFEALPTVACRWSEATEAAEIARGDIGVSWLPDDLWSRGKCGLKVLQYMAAGLPVVANPVGVHCELVRHGETGYLVSSAEEWSAAIRRLAADPKLRRRLGEAGRRHLERAYAVEVGAVRWLEVFQQLSVRPAA